MEEISLTTDTYWDCECEQNYIHAKSDQSCPSYLPGGICKVCHAFIELQPDSRIAEVQVMLDSMKTFEVTFTLVETVAITARSLDEAKDIVSIQGWYGLSEGGWEMLSSEIEGE